jgi:phage terminase large subunit-like protein
MTHPTTQYALEAVEGRRVVGKLEMQTCQRHIDDLARQGDPDFPYIFDEAKADKIIRWFGYCKHIQGPFAGQPIELLPFQKFDLGVIFGWIHKHTGYRRFEKCYVQMARKNAKTTILAGVALYLMVGDKEESPSVYCAAVDRGQARLMYDLASAMAEKSKDIRKRLKIRQYSLTHRSRGGHMMALSKATKNKDGLNPSGAIIDEYHAHPTSEIYDLIWSAWGQRAQALMAIITTAGMDVDSPCYREYDYCQRILSGDVTNERYFVMIRQLDKEDDEHDPAVWIKTNPLRASTPEGLARLKEQHNEALDSLDPAKIRTWRVKNLNIWVHSNEDSYMGEYMERWDALAVTREQFIEMTKDTISNVGVDLSMKIDLTADAHLFALDSERVAITAHGFMPEESVKQHEKTDKAPYRDWAAAGWLTITEGDVTDYRKVQEHIQDSELDHGWKAHELAFDPYNATMFANEMMDEGYTCIEIRQGVKTLSEPTKLFRELVADGKIVHDGSPLLKWCVANAVQISDSNQNIKLSKKNATATKRIDLLAAAINALVRLQSLKEASFFADYVNSDEFGF